RDGGGAVGPKEGELEGPRGVEGEVVASGEEDDALVVIQGIEAADLAEDALLRHAVTLGAGAACRHAAGKLARGNEAIRWCAADAPRSAAPRSAEPVVLQEPGHNCRNPGYEHQEQ